MTSSTAELLRRDDGGDLHDAEPARAPDAPRGRTGAPRPGTPRPGTLRLVIAGRPAPAAEPPTRAVPGRAQPLDPGVPSGVQAPAPLRLPREAARVTAHRAVIEVAGRLLPRRASDQDLGLQARRALVTDLAGPDPRPSARHELIHASPAFCDGTWTRPRRPARLVRPCRRGPPLDRAPSVSLQRLAGPDESLILLTPRRRSPFGGRAVLGLRASAPAEDLGAALRQALALSR